MSNIKAWIISLRLRTLPLALSTIFLGSFLAVGEDAFRMDVLTLAALTTLFLQILSNLANDYGDALSGADNEERQGPKRMIQSGVISLKRMKRAIVITSFLALASGLTLIYVSIKGDQLYAFFFFLMGMAAITAAIRYTVGKNPYGYRGFGDLYVFIFFGLLGVGGTFFLHTGYWQWPVLLPAAAIGFFSTGVLNLNNIRDIESDKKSGKNTLPVMLGRKKAAFYHFSLLTLGWVAMLIWLLGFETRPGAWLTLISLPVFAKSVLAVLRFSKPSTQLDPELRNLSLGTLLFVILYGTGTYFL
ncbi:1,4-dihydroxy-2-naphthoate polyprenyltransferase [Marinilabilia rubra]|uniref:1,4-dihydroxy-2-naphthoate octaprenyltransferase n=1 Tax=Marinilabilia rubra TaxID=2162893 RepID=A0A2U2B6H7_9BACT|nr:1,4-dihydroxy-2-naphthoate polyprenyltransferase [Marinilabilia rubra]PWD98665.1 1,4-dihydroxy-2-naphthoate octaprenyltransferase [Marinilabilia rubra]